jgi:hypothetical protein
MLLSEAEANNDYGAMVNHSHALRGRRPYACEDIHHTEPGRS